MDVRSGTTLNAQLAASKGGDMIFQPAEDSATVSSQHEEGGVARSEWQT